MSVISLAVSPGKANQRDDVVIIQRLLNKHLSKLKPPVLKLDGRLGPRTEEAIRLFQSRVMHMARPDGCVEPHGPTLNGLTAGANQTTLAKPAHHVPAHVNAFLSMTLPAARRVSAKWDVPVSVILAQSALESGWGKHVVNNAYFGIKGKSASGNSTTFQTTEVIGGKVIHLKDQFRAYRDYEESADDYGRFLNENQRYRGAFAFKSNSSNFIDEIARVGYATDPHYAASLKNIVSRYGFDQYDTPQGRTLP